MIRAAIAFRNAGYGTPVLVGREDRIQATVARARHPAARTASRSTTRACPTATGATPSSSTPAASARASCSATASAWSTRTATSSPPAWWRPAMPTRWSPARPASYSVALEGVRTAIDPAPGGVLFGLTLMLARVSGTVFVADTAIHERPGRRDAGRDRHPVRRRGAAPRARAARRLPVLLHLRRSQGLHPRLHPRGGEAARRARRRFRVRRRDGGRRRARPGAAGAASTPSAA